MAKAPFRYSNSFKDTWEFDCPICGDIYTHLISATVFRSSDDRPAIEVTGFCEIGGHGFAMWFWNSMGLTEITFRLLDPTNLKDAADLASMGLPFNEP